MKAYDFTRKLIHTSYIDTVYALGFLGQEVTEASIATAIKNNPLLAPWYTDEKIRYLLSLKNTRYGFDCICLLKAILWGWDYSNDSMGKGVKYDRTKDLDTEQMLNICTDISDDFSLIQPGEYLWIPGHAGVYIGNGWAAECTYRWDDGVQLTRVYNVLEKKDDNGRHWTKHGKLPYVEYDYITKEEKLKETQDAFLYGLLEMLQDIVDGISKPSLS